MPQTVIKVSSKKLENMKKYYMDYLKDSFPPNTSFAAKVEGCAITAYNSGKVLFQGNNHELEARKWGSPEQKGTGKSNSTKTVPNCVSKSHIGSDEAGTGDFFGPITASAAFVDEKNIALLKELGVRDSKQMKDDQIMEVAKQIQFANIPHSILVLHNSKYNRLQQQGWTQGKMKAMLHYHTIQNVLNKIGNGDVEGIVIDQFAEKQVFERHLATENIKLPLPEKVYFMTKAESYSIAVATASILARAKFVMEMDNLSKEIGFSLQKGASKLVDEQAAKIILTKGRDKLFSISKVHFANTTKALQLVAKKNK